MRSEGVAPLNLKDNEALERTEATLLEPDDSWKALERCFDLSISVPRAPEREVKALGMPEEIVRASETPEERVRVSGTPGRRVGGSGMPEEVASESLRCQREE